MSETDIRIPLDPYPGEYWLQTPSYRWAALPESAGLPPVLQVAWQSNYHRIEWRRVETVAVSRAEYEAQP